MLRIFLRMNRPLVVSPAALERCGRWSGRNSLMFGPTDRTQLLPRPNLRPTLTLTAGLGLMPLSESYISASPIATSYLKVSSSDLILGLKTMSRNPIHDPEIIIEIWKLVLKSSDIEISYTMWCYVGLFGACTVLEGSHELLSSLS